MEFTLKQRVMRAFGRQLWIPGREKLLKKIVDPEKQGPAAFEVDFFGLRYTGKLSNYLDWMVFHGGAFVPHELSLLKDVAAAIRKQGKPINFYDVGANIGHHTMFMSLHSDKIFAFEPFEVVRNEMKRKLAHAGVETVTVFPVALGAENEIGAYHPPTGANQGTGSLSNEIADQSSEETIPVTVVCGDDFIESNGLPPISLLKMDVEGYEIKVLEGLRRTLARDRPPILVEIKNEKLNRPGLSVLDEVKKRIYPDHLIFTIDSTRTGKYMLKPFGSVKSDEALILPKEMAGMVPGTGNL